MSADDLRQLVQLTAGLLILVGLYMAFAPFGSCDICPHCRQERLDDSFCPIHRSIRRKCAALHEDKPK